MLVIEDEISEQVRELHICQYNFDTFQDILLRIQKSVDDLSLHQYSNLPQWVAKLDEQVGY